MSAIRYKYDSACPKCGKHYAMQESTKPRIREVKAHDGIKKTTFRKYRCKHCGYEDEIPYAETISYEDQDEL